MKKTKNSHADVLALCQRLEKGKVTDEDIVTFLNFSEELVAQVRKVAALVVETLKMIRDRPKGSDMAKRRSKAAGQKKRLPGT